MLEIWHGLQRCRERKERAALATIVAVDGAAYRREGTRCLILESGEIIGTLSGGCVEGDLLEHARTVMDTGIPQEIRYDFRLEDDLLWGLGVGCNGALTVWLQPFDSVRRPQQADEWIQAFQHRVSCLRSYTAAWVLESDDPTKLPAGAHLVIDRPEESFGRFLPSKAGMGYDTVNGIAVKLFMERVQPRPRLILFGAGSGAVPLVQGAKSLQWHVTLVDHRNDYVNREHFRIADERILTSRHSYSEYSVIDGAFVVIMTHNYELDRMLVQTLLPQSIPYLGVLGSRNRIERMLREIRHDHGELTEEVLEKLHSPIGLDIGAESPEEIAISILSELVSRKNGRSGQPLRQRKEPLHERQQADGLLAHPYETDDYEDDQRLVGKGGSTVEA